MAATVEIERYTGVGAATVNTITGVNTVGQTTDAHTTAVGSSAPIQIPTVGTNEGYWVHTGLNVTAAPATGISNTRWYLDGTDNTGTDVTIRVGEVDNRANYDQATGTPNVSATNPLTVANYNAGVGLSQFDANAFNYDSVSPLTLTSGSIGAVTGLLGGYVVYQFVVGPTAVPGPTSTPGPIETVTWAFDES